MDEVVVADQPAEYLESLLDYLAALSTTPFRCHRCGMPRARSWP